MPVRMLNFLKNPLPQSRWAHSVVKETEEWKEVSRALRAELNPHEYLAVEFPEGHAVYKEMKDPTFAMWHHIKKEIKALGLPYDVLTRNKTIYIVGKNDLS